MAKKTLNPSASGPALYPCPVVLVSAIDLKGNTNFLTIAWCGVVCSEPPMISVSIRPSRHTHHMIKEMKEFVVNIPRASAIKQVDLAGILSGKRVDKFKKLDFTPVDGSKVKSPSIKECPVNIECKLVDTITLGSHDMFIGKVESVLVDEELLDKDQNIDYNNAEVFVYNQGEYRSVSEKIGYYGFSVKDK